jgi:hypothetical protein
LEQQAWVALPGVASGMLAAAVDDAAQERAVLAVGKLLGHMPGEPAAATLAAVAARAQSLALSGSAAAGLLVMLCTAVQHADSDGAVQQLTAAVLHCAAASPPLQTAALLLPALAIQQPCSAAAEWSKPVEAAMQLITGALEQLERAAAQPQAQPLGSALQAQQLLEAALLPANALRRVLGAADKSMAGLAGAVQHLGGVAAAGQVADVLDLLCGMVGACSRLHAGQASSLRSQGHAAAVALVAAARLRVAAVQAGGALQPCSSEAVGRLLGWDLQSYCGGR